mgnify:CR=1 FL=1
MQKLGRNISRIIDLFTNLGGLLIIVMMLHVTIDVIMRNIFRSGLDGTIEIVSNYYMVMIGFLSLCFAEEKNRHISVELITDQMPLWLQRHLAGLSYLIGTVVFGFLTARTFVEAQKKMSVGAFVTQGTSDVAIWPAYYAIPVGCFLMLLVVLYKLACYVTNSRSGLNESMNDLDPESETGAEV